MQIVHSQHNTDNVPLALTIGNFDGVHLGHQAIVKTLVETAAAQGYRPAVMTFSPHAKIFFGNAINFLINSDAEKAALLSRYQIETLYQIPFDRQFSEIAANDFVLRLIHQLQVKYLLVGDDFRFGYQGRGNFELLSRLCQQHGVLVQNTPTIRYAGERISSSRVRAAINDSNFDLVEVLLGRRLTYSGKVISGKQLGRTINYPTANIRLPETRLLPSGVFAVRVSIDEADNANTVYQGMCNIGHKPTVDKDKIRQIETHLFDFSGDLYGKRLTIEPVAKIRDEQKFSGIEALLSQLHQDKKESLQRLTAS